MTSALQGIADTIATDFRQAVIDAEKADMETIDKILADLNAAYHEYTVKEQVLDTKSEDALRTLKEIGDLRDVNATTLSRRVEALREELRAFRQTKVIETDTFKFEPDENVVKLGDAQRAIGKT